MGAGLFVSLDVGTRALWLGLPSVFTAPAVAPPPNGERQFHHKFTWRPLQPVRLYPTSAQHPPELRDERKHRMRRHVIMAACVAAALSGAAATAEPLARCDGIPQTALITVFGGKDATAVCNEMLKVLDQPTTDDLIYFEKVAYLFNQQGYSKDYATITAELVDVIRLRGLYDKQPRWKETVDLLYRTYVAFHGAVTPEVAVDFLEGAGRR